MFKKIFIYLTHHKIIAGFLMLALAGSGYWAYKIIFPSTGQIKYVLAATTKGTLTSSVSGSGQVSVSNQVDITPKASGNVVAVNVTDGMGVAAGTILAQLDTTNAEKTVRDAQLNLDRAKLDLQKIQGGTENTSTVRSNKQKAIDDLTKAYDDGFSNIANTFLDLPGIVTGINTILFSDSIHKGGQWNIDYYSDSAKLYDPQASQYRDSAYMSYQAARAAYDQNFTDYKSTSRFSDTASIEKLINETYTTTRLVAEAVKNANNLIQFYKDRLSQNSITPNTTADTHLTLLNTYTGSTNSELLTLLTTKNTIQTDKEAIGGADLDLAGQQLAVRQSENSLRDAQEKLADYYIRAPFSGVVAKMNLKVGDSANTGTAAATLITHQKTAEISLNEVDAAKIKNGQKVTLTFDAIPDLTITGEVAEIDTVGTVSQGVVTYTVKIIFDTQDERVKPGMSVSAAIITDIKADVLLVPNSAVKTQGNTSYVEIPDSTDPNASQATNASGVTLSKTTHQQTVTTDLSNDEYTEILSGLKEGDIVIVRSIAPSTAPKTTAPSQSSSVRIPGLPGGSGGGGGGFRGN